ncbi:UTP-hexose-1-phosphate uridylyltransferase [Clostridium cavendishii DSM 21758]|uniref:Galactose-1-phosphate uridylyltransferase n=1 Tax=Clostridium cavendishii DSM 21758 TaxID=1121302 RepID=A0A1M6UI34_9CLOT|nr:UDP-glucose--hexose-1-phosphate uridylyltransferase [Clostridium cavendishii]SHK68915.1 UTP-hexose-1-phosphate uridylyltransferase [Clostridium cavendishii DSM 21758]
MNNIYHYIDSLIKYALDMSLIEQQDKIYYINKILAFLNLDNYEENRDIEITSLQDILLNIDNFALSNGVLKEDTVTRRELFETEIMGIFIDRPSNIIKEFNELYKNNPKSATDYFYDLSKNSNYIRTYDVKKDIKWKHKTKYGDLDITINLSKPEKDPKEIAASKLIKSSSYPKCLLCKENEGYIGRINHPGRSNHRIIPLILNKEKWFLQYSPYVYYNEHCIVLKENHEPMKITEDTFKRLSDFTEQFPHYFIGSNADLPIVGGSILAHDHFQGGNYEFAMSKSASEIEFEIKGFENIKASFIKWPMAVVRIKGKDKNTLVACANYILQKFKVYSDKNRNIIAFTKQEPHNTITPICRRRGEEFEFDLVLRNNRVSKEHPEGIYHPHKELHHIKKENIGLIEVMGLAVLPARLKGELKEAQAYLTGEKSLGDLKENDLIFKHKKWLQELINKKGIISKAEVESVIKKEVGNKFTSVLEHCDIFKGSLEGKKAFIDYLNK